jgi:hypothetical protein
MHLVPTLYVSTLEDAEFNIDNVPLDSFGNEYVDDVFHAYQTKENPRAKRQVNCLEVVDIALVNAWESVN